MIVVPLGAGIRRWLAVVCSSALLIAAIRWGLQREAAPVGSAPVGVLRSVAVRSDAVALTFPVPHGTRGVAATIKVLTAARTPATFFVGARYARHHPGHLRQLLHAGLEVEALGAAVGAPACGALRPLEAVGAQPVFLQLRHSPLPPSGLRRDALRCGLEPVAWTSAAGAAPEVTAAAARPGDILRLAVDPAAASTLPSLLRTLRSRAYTPLSLEALVALGQGGVAAGARGLA